MCVSPLKFDTLKVGWMYFITRSSRIEWQAIPRRRKGQSFLNGIFGLDTFNQKLKLYVQDELA